MAEVIRYSRFEEYYSANKNFIYENTLLNFFLIETINKVFAGKVPLYKFFNVVEDNSRQIILLVEDVCLIYGNGFNEDQIHMLSDELEFKKFKRYNFAGSKQIIDALFQINNARYSMDKHRIIYKCQQVLPDFEYSPGKMQMGDIRKLEELAIFSQAFSKAYDGKETTIDECRLIIYNGIMNDNFYQWNYNNNICSMAQAMHNDHDFPVIGHFYTNPSFRNQGFGASIIHKLTRGLMEAGNEVCMLVADATNPASNKAFIRVGYESVGEYLRAYKER